MKKNLKITYILAMDENRLIGSNNDLPWRLPADLQYFKQKTLNKTILMGRKTCQSLPFVLPKRRNIVLTRNTAFERKGFDVIHTLEDIQNMQNEIMVIGGAMIYKLLMPYANKLLITHIHHKFTGDTYFDWNPEQWLTSSEINHEADESNPYSYSFVEYTRKPLDS